MRSSIFGAAIMAIFAGPVMALGPLSQVDHVREGLISAGMAIEIADHCDDISVRLLRGYNFLGDLKDHARDLGYSDAQIDAYVDNDAEQDRLEAVARARLADLGVIAGQGATYCAVGQTQIDAGTPVGRLLR